MQMMGHYHSFGQKVLKGLSSNSVEFSAWLNGTVSHIISHIWQIRQHLRYTFLVTSWKTLEYFGKYNGA